MSSVDIKTIPLKEVAFYSKDRIDVSELDLDNYVGVDNLNQNKRGKTTATYILDNGRTTKYERGDILISNIRPYLKKIWYATNSGGSSADVLTLRVNQDFDSKFVYYNLLKDEFFDFVMLGSKGTRMPRGNKQQLLNFPIPAFSLERQDKIASILSNLDAKIELNNKINTELEKMAKTLYDYWFLQFDFPDESGKPYQSSGGEMVWSDELKREIPKGWEAGTIADIAILHRGVTYNKDDVKNKIDSNTTPILRATNISGNAIDLENMVYVPSSLVNEDQKLQKFDTLITMSSGSKEHIGKNGFYYFENEVAFGAFCAKIKAKTDYIFYLYSFTQSKFMFATIKNECLGTNINNLNGEMVQGFKLVVPANHIIQLFNNRVEPIYKKIGLNKQENQKLAELRDWLLPMLMNGQVTVNLI